MCLKNNIIWGHETMETMKTMKMKTLKTIIYHEKEHKIGHQDSFLEPELGTTQSWFVINCCPRSI